MRDYIGDYFRGFKEETRSFDYSSYRVGWLFLPKGLRYATVVALILGSQSD